MMTSVFMRTLPSGAAGASTRAESAFSVLIVSPALTASRRPSATVSPARAAPRFAGSSPRSVNTPATRSLDPPAAVTVDSFANLTWTNFFVNNLIPVTLGNIVGGAGLVGLVYWFAYLRGKKA